MAMTHSGLPARCGACAILILSLAGQDAAAQRRPAPEFTQQFILVGNFWVSGKETPSQTKNDLKLGREIGDWVRKGLTETVNKRETKVIDGYEIRESLIRAAFSPDASFSIPALRQQGQSFRTDEIIWGVATRLPDGG